MIGIGWFLAYINPHIMTPIIYVNVLALSKLLLVPSLIASSIILLCRIFQKQCILTLMIEKSIHALKPLKPFGIILIAISPIILEVASKIFAATYDEEEDEHEKERLNRDTIHVNWRGDYSGHKHWNKY